MQVGTLYVVATPIGNLDDITARALRVLGAVDVIAAEDTRRTTKLLSHFGIKTRMVSYHAHSGHDRLPSLVERLRGGQSVALVSDAGTPGISDPGAELVRACIMAGIPVDPIPGPSAPILALVASGFDLGRTTIFGFVPSRPKDKKAFLQSLATIEGVVVFFESPLRIRATLLAMSQILVDRPIVVAREMTKVHQEFLFGSSSDIEAQLKHAKGEFTVVVGSDVKYPYKNMLELDTAAVFRDFCQLTEMSGSNRRDALRAIARKHGTSLNSVYRIIEAHKILA